VAHLAVALPVTPALAYLALAGLVGIESAGIPLPGETALFTGALLADDGRLSIVVVIVVAAAAAIMGDNLGYLGGRRLGRRFAERPGAFADYRRTALDQADRFFARHGAKAVFLGRWVTGLRIWAAWVAGITHMRWKTFFTFNALGGICWAISIGLAGYFAGHAAQKLVERVGVGAAIAVVVLGALTLLFFHVRRRRNV
jgi:membrane-associated protein